MGRIPKFVLSALMLHCGMHAAPVAAHEFWLDMIDYAPKPGAKVPVVQRTGTNFLGDSFPYVRASSKRFSVIDGRGERVIKAIEGDDPAADVVFPNAGLAIVVYERAADTLTHPTMTRFLEVLEGEGLDHVPAQHRAMGWPETDIRESYARYAKALVKVGTGQGADRAVGLRFEIVVDGNPYDLARNADIPVRVFHDGRPVENVLVKAFNRADVQSPRSARTDVEGRASISGVSAGEVLLSAVIMMPGDLKPASKSSSNWSSLWASVTFKRP